MTVAQWIKDITEQACGKNPLHIGLVIKTDDGRKVKIVDGQYWGEYGLSNFWYWQEVLTKGNLGKKECGYGYINKLGQLEASKGKDDDK